MERIRGSTTTSRASRRKAYNQVQHHRDRINLFTINFFAHQLSGIRREQTYRYNILSATYLTYYIPKSDKYKYSICQFCSSTQDTVLNSARLRCRAPEWQRPLRLTDALDMPVPIYFSCDGCTQCHDRASQSAGSVRVLH